MGVAIAPQITFTAVRTLDFPAASQATVQQSGFNLSSGQLNENSTPPVTKESYKTLALVGGVLLIDLTALPDVNGIDQDCTGKKVRTIIVKNPKGNHPITVQPGDSNPYPVFGTGNKLEVKAHASVDGYFGQFIPDGVPDVSAGERILKITGTGTEQFHIGLTLG